MTNNDVIIHLSKLSGDYPNETPLYTFKFKNTKSCGLDFDSPVSATPLPNEDSTEQILIKLAGNSTQIKYSWVVKTNAENQEIEANITTKTVRDIISFFNTLMKPKLMTDRYRFTMYFEEGTDALSWDGTISSLKFDMDTSSPMVFVGSFVFYEGKVNGGIWELDGATAPTNVTLTKLTSPLRIKVDWGDPVKNEETTSWEVWYKKDTDVLWTIVKGIGSGLRQYTTPTLSAGNYKVRLRANSTNRGSGEFSGISEITI